MEWNKEEGIIFPFAFKLMISIGNIHWWYPLMIFIDEKNVQVQDEKKNVQVQDAMYYPSEKKRSSPRYHVLSFRKKTLKSEME